MSWYKVNCTDGEELVVDGLDELAKVIEKDFAGVNFSYYKMVKGRTLDGAEEIYPTDEDDILHDVLHEGYEVAVLGEDGSELNIELTSDPADAYWPFPEELP